jgi:hypothetical protein
MDFFDGDTNLLNCDQCARRNAPELYEFRRSAAFRKFEQGLQSRLYKLHMSGPQDKRMLSEAMLKEREECRRKVNT